MSRVSVLICLLCLIVAGSVAAEVTVSDISLPDQLVQQQRAEIAYHVAATGDDVSVTTFLAAGDVQEPPDEWWDNSIRSEPQYQLHKEALDGEPVAATAVFAPGKDTAPGIYTVFIAAHGTGGGWDIQRLGTVELVDSPRFNLPVIGETIAIWPGEVTKTARTLAQRLRDTGFDARTIDTRDLADPDGLTDRGCGLLILPDGGAYPAEARPAIQAWHEAGGAFLCLGGPGFPMAVGHDGEDVETQTWPVADMEGHETADTFHSEGADGTIEYVTPGAADTAGALEVFFNAEAGWFYATLPAPDPVPPQARYLEFVARGDAKTDRLCLEIVGEDGSRWKYFVQLDTQWQSYTVPIDDFAIYVQAAGDSQRVLDPQKADELKFGIYRNLYENQTDHTFFLDEVRLSSTPHNPVEPLHDHAQQWASEYSHLCAQPPLGLFGLAERPRKLEGSRQVRTADSQAVVSNVDLTVDNVWEIVPQIRSAGEDRRIFNQPVHSRWLHFLEAVPIGHDPPAVIAGATVAHCGMSRSRVPPGPDCIPGARWGYIGIDAERIVVDEQLSDAFTSLAAFLVSPTVMAPPHPEFTAGADGIGQTWEVPVMHLGRDAQTASLMFETPAGDQYSGSATDLAGGESRILSVTVPPEELDMATLGGTISLHAGGETIDQISVLADAKATLQQIGEWLIANQTEAGNSSNWYYADVYGARAQRVLSELTGDDRYRRSGLKMLDMLVENQREDGGWWVGYGPPGEAVFVADDGCIALGLTQMAPYVGDERRDAYLGAVRDHIAFRQSFRQTPEVVEELEQEYGDDATGILEGGLGIGYVLRDYFGEERYDSPRPEMRQKPWTLHCSLAFLGGLCALDQGPKYCVMASRDTDWFLDRVEEGSDSVKSGYANEAAVWMHDTLKNDALRRRVAGHLQGQFFDYMRQAPDGWWLRSDARYALSVPGLVYCDRTFDADPEVTAQLARTLWGICSESEPNALPNILRRYPESSIGSASMYANFASCALAEILEPRSTMLPEKSE